jgi:hypothetical protein
MRKAEELFAGGAIPTHQVGACIFDYADRIRRVRKLGGATRIQAVVAAMQQKAIAP